MTPRRDAEITAFVQETWPELGEWNSDRQQPLVIRREPDGAVILELSNMYEYVDLTFAHLSKVAKFFGTENVSEERYSSEGCETCDYGSNYQITLRVAPPSAPPKEKA